MKVLHVAETIKGGVATVLRQLLSDRSGERELYCLVPDAHRKELHEFDNENAFFFKRSGRDVKSLFSLLINYIRFIKKYRPEIIHIHSSFAGVVCRSVLPFVYLWYKPKVVYCPHAFSFIMNVAEKKKKMYSLIERALLTLTDRVVCTSYYEMNEAIRWGIKESKCRVVYNGIPAPKASDSETNETVHGDEIKILYVGRFDYQKGFDVLLQVANRLPTGMHITAIGDVVHADESPPSHEKISYLGWLDYHLIVPYFNNSTLLLMPSRWESFGLVAVEAQSFGLPVVASRCSSLPEVVDEGRTGFLFETENVDEIMSILNSKTKSDWKSMHQNCINYYSGKFTSEIMLKEVNRLYKELM
ncbi:glycosyltransferase [Serratia ureilytica]|nr:glycosyltransferase [Serratia ureilytica]BEL93735.1 glycosyl transferase [Serratia marcescens]